MNLDQTHLLNLDFKKRDGLLPVIIQNSSDNLILMLGWTNEEAFSMTIETGFATFWSTSRKEIWVKGATSGDFLKVKDILIDCDQDTLIYLVDMQGNGACHTKNKEGKSRTSCFYRRIGSDLKLHFIDE